MEALIKQLRLAEQGGRVLDCAIEEFLWPIYAGWKYVGWLDHIEYWVGPDGEREDCSAGEYTTSIDAALSLVPAAYRGNWDIKYRNGPNGSCRAELYRPSYQVDALARTPALAVCMAAIRARGAERVDAESRTKSTVENSA